MELNNLARVADALGQSTVSVHRALHSLEDGLRCPLFKREGPSLIPLHAAYAFAESTRRALAECEEGVRKVREMSGINPVRLKIGSLYSLTLHCIPQLLIALKLRRPGLDIDLPLGSNRELLQSLADGRLDAIKQITLLMLSSRERDPNLLALAAECRLHGRCEPANA